MSVPWGELIPRIAHDARALVRKGLTNAQLLERSLGSGPDVSGSPHLRAIVESQTDLNYFLVRLVALAGAERAPARPGRPEDVADLGTVILGARLECKASIQSAGAVIAVGELPACLVPLSLQTVLKELIDNSVRYRNPAREPRIEIAAELDRGIIRIRVSDNGTGVTPAYAGKLFQPLQRLDTVRSGFGFGLAIAQTIVDAAGGSIRAEPSEEGATFVFELPIQS